MIKSPEVLPGRRAGTAQQLPQASIGTFLLPKPSGLLHFAAFEDASGRPRVAQRQRQWMARAGVFTDPPGTVP